MSNRLIDNKVYDELSWDTIHQFHTAISNFSKQSFDIKKLFITVVISALTLIYSISKSIDLSLFVTVAIIVGLFYSLDSMTYYYQDKLRAKMAEEQNKIRERNGIPIIAYHRNDWRFFRSLFNWSHLLYASILILDLVLYFIFCE